MKVVIFDMDGLMFDTEKVFIKAWDYAGEKLGIGKAGYMTLRTLGMSIVMSKSIWIEEFGDKYNEILLRQYTKEFLKDYYSKNIVPVKEGLFELLEYLKSKNVKLAVASSSPQWEVNKHLSDVNIQNYFTAIICGDMVKNSKPDPMIYSNTIKILGKKPEDCYALEDSKNGVLSAVAAGCKTIMIPDLWEPNNEILEIIDSKFCNLKGVINYFKDNNVFKN